MYSYRTNHDHYFAFYDHIPYEGFYEDVYFFESKELIYDSKVLADFCGACNHIISEVGGDDSYWECGCEDFDEDDIQVVLRSLEMRWRYVLCDDH